VFRGARGGYFVADAGNGWQDAYAKELATAARPARGVLQAAK
jgi:hypothetical protein